MISNASIKNLKEVEEKSKVKKEEWNYLLQLISL